MTWIRSQIFQQFCIPRMYRNQGWFTQGSCDLSSKPHPHRPFPDLTLFPPLPEKLLRLAVMDHQEKNTGLRSCTCTGNQCSKAKSAVIHQGKEGKCGALHANLLSPKPSDEPAFSRPTVLLENNVVGYFCVHKHVEQEGQLDQVIAGM